MASSMEKAKQRGAGRIGNARKSNFLRMSAGWSEMVTFTQRPEGGEGRAMRNIYGKNFPGRGKSKSKGPEAGGVLSV